MLPIHIPIALLARSFGAHLVGSEDLVKALKVGPSTFALLRQASYHMVVIVVEVPVCVLRADDQDLVVVCPCELATVQLLTVHPLLKLVH